TGTAAGVVTLAPSCTVASLALAPCPPHDASTMTFVDPVDGWDDLRYGGGEGACASRTLTWALKGAGPVTAAAGTYAAPAETPPFVVDGTKSLHCRPGATLRGSGSSAPAGTEAVAVALAGLGNTIEGCTVIGGTGPLEIGILAVTVGNGAGHHITD